MPIPPYMWLKDDGGAHIKGSVDVQDREGSIEIIGLSHGLNLPVDSATARSPARVNTHLCGLKRKLIAPRPTFTKQHLPVRHSKALKLSSIILMMPDRKSVITLY